MMKYQLSTLISSVAAGLLLVGCYNDFDTPSPAPVMTDEQMLEDGLAYISIGDLKQKFYSAKGDNPGQPGSLTIAEPLYTRGKVISSDRDGNIYKSLYIYDSGSQSAIELKLASGNYLFHPVGQIVFVKLQELVVGNYRGMLSIGTRSSDTNYSNDNIETDILRREHIFAGEQQAMLASDTLVITKENYTTVLNESNGMYGQNALGRLVRFEGVKSHYGTAKWGYQNTFPNYFANSTSYDVNSPGWSDIPEWATWAAKRALPNASGSFTETYFYGSAWFTYADPNEGAQGKYTPGNYVIRTSGYSSFRDGRIPADGATVDITAIYTIYTSSSATPATAKGNCAYQLVLNSEKDVVVKNDGSETSDEPANPDSQE
ncbi:MAG: DUF5689 domain-containing protein [Alistipes senegalensis]|nr:DUF5689 domain-containing protein [Bacteroides cellulosilyticus]MCM1352151.1 DUF5689 domain-containing protein [Alistipes senegalensis]